MSEYNQIIKTIQDFEGLYFEVDYDLIKDGKTLPITIETNLQVIHHNVRNPRIPFSSWGLKTVKTTYKDGDHWKINYYDNDAPDLEKLLDKQIISKHGNILLFTKDELLGVLEYLDHKGIAIKET